MSDQVMPDPFSTPTREAEAQPATEARDWLQRQRPPRLERIEADLPRLYTPGARTVARDRWERIVSSHTIPAPREAVWRALTDPAALRQWFMACHGVLEAGRDCTLDFEDGDFFLCRPIVVRAPSYLEWRWRWLGIGPSWTVKWYLREEKDGTRVSVVDEALNPAARTGHYRGEGWPEILDILAAYLRTNTNYRWPCRSQSYAVVNVPMTLYGAWDRLFPAHGLKWWLRAYTGSLSAGETLTFDMGDASGSVQLRIEHVVPPAYNTYPFIAFAMRRPFWPCDVPGRLFLEPGGWGEAILQVFQTGWENLGPALQLRERRIVVGFWADAFRRAVQFCGSDGPPRRASPWVLSDLETDDPTAFALPSESEP
jgi:uncharacterized protein YndB with AHSA1/START domain